MYHLVLEMKIKKSFIFGWASGVVPRSSTLIPHKIFVSSIKNSHWLKNLFENFRFFMYFLSCFSFIFCFLFLVCFSFFKYAFVVWKYETSIDFLWDICLIRFGLLVFVNLLLQFLRCCVTRLRFILTATHRFSRYLSGLVHGIFYLINRLKICKILMIFFASRFFGFFVIFYFFRCHIFQKWIFKKKFSFMHIIFSWFQKVQIHA